MKKVIMIVVVLFASVNLVACGNSLSAKYPDLKPGQEIVLEQTEGKHAHKHVVKMDEDETIRETYVAVEPK